MPGDSAILVSVASAGKTTESELKMAIAITFFHRKLIVFSSSE
jgi:hypothetical protein